MYSRNLNGQIMTMAASGWTWHDKFVMQDLETGSLWWTGVGLEGNDTMLCLSGPRQNNRTEKIESYRGSWHGWVAGHPHSKYLKTK